MKEYLQEKYDKMFDFGTCAICSIALADSEMFDCRTYPDVVYSLLKRWKGINRNNHIIWKRLEWIFSIKSRVFLFSKRHYDLDTIQTPAIISIDGNKFKDGYQSHFMYLRKIIYHDILKKEILADIFCPIRGNKKLKLKQEEIYSIINLTAGTKQS